MQKVSVMMPAYNVEKYIGEAIESVLNQTFQDFELVILDDGSTDSTYEIMQAYAQKSDKIRLLQNDQNRGLSYTRNRLLEEAQGEYLAILDSDDISFPDRLQKQVDFLDKNPSVGLLGGAVEYFGDAQREGEISRMMSGSDKIACYMLFHNVFGQSTVMFRSSLKHLKYNPDRPPAEDYDLWVRMSWEVQTDNLPDVLVRYRVHGNNISKLKRDILLQSVRQTHLMQLERLGINATETELNLHKLIADFRSDIDKQEFSAALSWLERLFLSNQSAGIYPQKAFEDEIRSRVLYLFSFAHRWGGDFLEIIQEKKYLLSLLTAKERVQYWLLAKAKGGNAMAPYRFLYQMYQKVK
jgi:glycosyltransferase involved in cell wall biosynthesis